MDPVPPRAPRDLMTVGAALLPPRAPRDPTTDGVTDGAAPASPVRAPASRARALANLERALANPARGHPSHPRDLVQKTSTTNGCGSPMNPKRVGADPAASLERDLTPDLASQARDPTEVMTGPAVEAASQVKAPTDPASPERALTEPQEMLGPQEMSGPATTTAGSLITTPTGSEMMAQLMTGQAPLEVDPLAAAANLARDLMDPASPERDPTVVMTGPAPLVAVASLARVLLEVTTGPAPLVAVASLARVLLEVTTGPAMTGLAPLVAVASLARDPMEEVMDLANPARAPMVPPVAMTGLVP